MAFKASHSQTNLGRPKLDAEALMVKIYYEAPKGLTNEQLADFLGIHVASIYELIKDNSDFNEAIKHYKRISPIEVLNSFKKLAVGYTAEETKKELRKQKDGSYKMVLTEVVKKHFQPNATAGIFYLKNQMPEEFKDKVETVHTVTDMESILFAVKRRENNE